MYVLPRLLQPSVKWTAHNRHQTLLEKFHRICLKRIRKIKYRNFRNVSAVELRVCCFIIVSYTFISQITWIGNVQIKGEENHFECLRSLVTHIKKKRQLWALKLQLR